MFFAGFNGVTAFYPDQIHTNQQIPPVVLTGFEVFRKSVVLDTIITEKKVISLSYSDNVFSIEFAALDYSQPHKNQFAYQLRGFDKEWVYAGHRRRATYTNVPPGEYTFRIKGSNNDGVWNEEGASVRIIINPPYWARWWFRSAAALCVILLLFALYRYRVNRLLEIERTRLRIARDLHDDIGSSLSSIALESELVQNKAALDEAEKTRLSRIAQRSRQLIEALDDIVWAINPTNDRLDNLLLRMKETAEDVLSKNGIRCSIQAPKTELPLSLEMEFRRHLFLIFKELLTNVIKHAQATHVTIFLAKQDGVLILKVRDNGVGFEPGAVQSGNGLSNMKMRAMRIHGQIKFQQPTEGGTEATLTVKIP